MSTPSDQTRPPQPPADGSGDPASAGYVPPPASTPTPGVVRPPSETPVEVATSAEVGPGTFSSPGTGEAPDPIPVTITPEVAQPTTPAGPLTVADALWHAAPAQGEHFPTPADGAAPLTPVLTRRWASPRSWSLDTYRQLDGYQALPAALAVDPGRLTELIKSSGLRGRGGAGFPTGLKWSFLPQGDTKPHYLVINADEGEPGTCKDIPLMMADPHSLIEGCIITSYAIRAPFCAIYIRGEAVHAMRRVQHAVNEAKAAGLLGENILGSGYGLEIVVHGGAGAYICGEETALLDSLEGRRGQPRLKPPFPAIAGLYASPTVVNNVETIASVPAIVLGGSDWYRSMGTEKSPGPKIYSLSGHVTNPGQYEAPMGTTLRELLVSAGGMLDGIPLKFFTPGGSSTPIFTPEHLDVPLSFDDVAAAGSMLGTTALMCFNETVSVPWAVWKWLEFYKHESCGKCTPCREGTGWLVQILRRIVSGAGTLEDLDTMTDAASNIAGRSFCALGDAAATPILSSFKYFRSEFEDLVTGRTPPVVESRLLVGAH